MRTALCFAMLLIPTIALAQGATPAKRPTVGAKPLVQVMPRARYPCTFDSCVRQPFASNPPHTQGYYDFIDIVDAPNQEAMLAFSVWYATQGLGRIQSMPAFDAKSFETAIKDAAG